MKSFPIVLVSTFFLSACMGSGSDEEPAVKETKEVSQFGYQEAALEVSDTYWMGSTTVLNGQEDPLPTNKESKTGVRIKVSPGLPLDSFARELSRQAGLKTVVVMPPSSNVAAMALPVIEADYVGPLSDLLNKIEADTGTDWRYSQSTRTLRLIPGPSQNAGTEVAKASHNWTIEPARHATVQAVLNDWSAQSGWKVAWEAQGLDYRVSQSGGFTGTYQEAVGGLIDNHGENLGIQPLFFYENRLLVIRKKADY